MSNVVHYRNKCIGCGICFEQQPELWRMSKKDGKATLVGGKEKNNVFVLKITNQQTDDTTAIAAQCPVKIIKVF